MRSTSKSPERTQEIDASDVLEVIQVAPAVQSSPSIRPFGLDVPEGAASDPTRDPTVMVRLAARRRNLARYVVAAVGISCAILVTSLVKRSSSEPSRRSVAVAAATPPAPPQATGSPPGPAAAAPMQGAPTTTPPPPTVAAEVATSGTIRFTTRPGAAWLDGKRLTGTSAVVPCGAHPVKVGWGPKHLVSVPCGGEVTISR